jgi:hypothetical protein
VWQQAAAGRARGGRRGAKGTAANSKPAAPRAATAGRALAILELVGSRVASWEAAQQLTAALLPLLKAKEAGGARRRRGRGDERLTVRTLSVLAALWSRLPPVELPSRPAAEQQLWEVAAALAPLAGDLEAQESRWACREH